MTVSMSAFVSRDMGRLPLIAYETVLIETPALAATSFMVAKSLLLELSVVQCFEILPVEIGETFIETFRRIGIIRG
jgi:hypothetical protein